MMERPNGVEDWVDETGRIILIGEAAHPWQVSRRRNRGIIQTASHVTLSRSPEVHTGPA